jgi:Uma2 family endonuclease
MASAPNFLALFNSLEREADALPDGTSAEIVNGVFLMSPRPRVRHGAAQGALLAELSSRFGRRARDGGVAPPAEWLFVIEPELRAERAFSRLIPDVAGWRRSTTGWPDPDAALVELMPEWVAEVLSPGSEQTDRGAKLDLYGVLGVGFVWLLDPVARTVEVCANDRGRMLRETVFAPHERLDACPFEGLDIETSTLFLDPGR